MEEESRQNIFAVSRSSFGMSGMLPIVFEEKERKKHESPAKKLNPTSNR
jgi:hypothetical protein